MNRKNRNVLFSILVILVLIYLIWQGYKQAWTGFNTTPEYTGYSAGKYLWDWLEILIVPLALTLIGIYFNARQKKAEIESTIEAENKKRAENKIKGQENELSQYFDKMNGLMLRDGLSKESASPEVKSIARSITVEVLRKLDIEHIPTVIKYLYENRLIDKENTKVDLSGIRFDKIDLSKRNFSGINLSGVIIYVSNFSQTDFSNSNLSGARLSQCNLRDSKFSGADITATSFQSSILTRADFRNTQGPRADFSYTEMFETIFVNANLPNSEYFQASIIQTIFKDANLYRAMLVQTVILDSFMNGANLEGATISAYISGSAPLKDNWTPPAFENEGTNKKKGIRNLITRLFSKKRKAKERMPF